LLDVTQHPSQPKYPNQSILMVSIENYVYLVPFIEEENSYFLKTMIPSRKATRDYLEKKVSQMSDLDPYELDVLNAFEGGLLKSIATKSEIDALRAAARATSTKDKRVNICLSSFDLNDIQVEAMEEGVPYQTLIASVLHK
jgi:predicted DNA binding CopG/RHH family protein